MPELPEVETVRLGLQAHLQGAQIRAAEMHRYDLRRPVPRDLAGRITGQTIQALARRGKYLLLTLERTTLLFHLGMSGTLRLERHDGITRRVHDHMTLSTSRHRVTFNDPRRFGMIDLIEPTGLHLGPEPLDEAFDGGYLVRVFRGRTRRLKDALLDQQVVAGLGNIYVCESLWRARLSPLWPCARLTLPQCQRLSGAIKEVLGEAINAGGSSLRDHRQADGALGYFQHQWRCYGREGERCQFVFSDGRVCRGIIRRSVQGNRSTFYCATHQRAAIL